MELFKLFGTIAINNDAANRAIDDTTGKAEKSEGRMSSAFKKIGAAVAAAFAVDKIVGFGKAIVDAAAEVDAETSAFGQIMGDYTDNAREKLNAVADSTGVMATRMQGHFTSLSAKFKGLGFDVQDATDLAQRGLTLAADAAAFWDVSLDDSSAHLNSFINGSYEGGEAIGLFANDTQMAMYAVQEGIVASTKEWANLDEATKQATRLEYAENMYKQSGATGQAAREADQYANVQANLTEKWRQFKAEIGEPLLQNIVIPAMDKLSTLVDGISQGFQTLKTWVTENQTAIRNITTAVEIAAAAFVALKAGMMIQGVVQGFQSAQVAISLLSMEIGGANLAQAALNGTMTIGETIVGLLTGKIKLAALAQGLMTKAQAALNAVMYANPIGIVIAAIVALVAAFVILWNKSEGFRNFWINLWEGIKNVTSTVVEGIKTFFTGLWEHVKTVWDTIKNVVQVAIMFIASILDAAFQILTLPWRFIWKNFGEYIIAAWEWIKETVSKAIEAIRETLVKVWSAISTALSPILEGIKNTVSTVWNAIKTGITTVMNAIKAFIIPIWNNIESAVTTAVNGIKSVVTSVWNSIKSTTSSVFNAVKSTVTSVWNGIKSAIETPINAAKNTVKSGLAAIKGFFDNLKIKFPSIKLPHFKISGSFSLSPPSVPKLSIDWYKKAMNNAMLLNSPTIFGVNPSGQLMGGGEAGQEVVAGSGTLMNMIQGAVRNENSGISGRLEKLISILQEFLPEVIANMGNDIVMDDGVLVGRLAPKLDVKLGQINRMKGRGQ